MEASASKQWSVAFSCCLLNFMQTSGFFFTPTVIMPLLAHDLDLDLSLSTVPIAVGKMAYVLMLIPGGMLVDAYGPRRCVLLGIAGLALLLSLYSVLVSSFAHVIAAHVAMATVSSVSGVPVYSLFIAQWFDDGIGLAMGLTLAGFSLGGTIMPAVLGPVAAEFGWRAAVAVMSSFLWLVGLPVAYAFLDEKPDDAAYFEEIDFPRDSESGYDKSEELPLLSPPPPPVDDRAPPEPRERVPVRVDNDDKSWTFVGFAMSYILLQYSTLSRVVFTAVPHAD